MLTTGIGSLSFLSIWLICAKIWRHVPDAGAVDFGAHFEIVLICCADTKEKIRLIQLAHILGIGIRLDIGEVALARVEG